MTAPASASTVSHWVIFPRRRPEARLRLFCLPYAGAGASAYHAWTHALPGEIELCPVQLPGRESRLREAPFERLGPLVAALAVALQPHLDMPYALFGHSLGALTAFELARQLRRMNQPAPVQLLISARRAPHLPEADGPLHTLPRDVFLARVQQRYNAIPALILQDAELLELFWPTLRADFTVLETYEYSGDAPLDCPLAAFGGQDDARVTAESLSAWRSHTTNTFTLEFFDGGHFYLQTQRAALLQSMARALAAHW